MSIFGLCFMLVCLIKSNCYSLFAAVILLIITNWLRQTFWKCPFHVLFLWLSNMSKSLNKISEHSFKTFFLSFWVRLSPRTYGICKIRNVKIKLTYGVTISYFQKLHNILNFCFLFSYIICEPWSITVKSNNCSFLARFRNMWRVNRDGKYLMTLFVFFFRWWFCCWYLT